MIPLCCQLHKDIGGVRVATEIERKVAGLSLTFAFVYITTLFV